MIHRIEKRDRTEYQCWWIGTRNFALMAVHSDNRGHITIDVLMRPVLIRTRDGWAAFDRRKHA